MKYPTPPQFSAAQLQQIDDICNAFEDAFRSGQTPRIEDFVAQADEPLRNALLPELVQLELHYRPDCPTAEWVERYPELGRTIVDGFAGKTDDSFPVIPGYYIIDELGRGGMGVVYRAADLTLHRHVALKMIHRSGQISSEQRRRFLGEARAVAQLHHPNLVQIFDSGEHDGHPFLVFEIVEGGTLVDQIQGERLTWRKSAELMKTLCEALQFAHERHIIHRDLKPSNILLGQDGVPRIGDFGLAKRLDDDRDETQTGLVIGTPSYMAPEQADGLECASSPTVDVYSMGAILYELLTGRPPFKAASLMETLDQLRCREPVAPRYINSDVPRDLETICLKCLQKDPGRRYLSARIVAEELGRFLRGESIIARRVGTVERTGRWCRRHPLPTALAVTLLLVGVAAFAAVSWQWNVAVTHQKLAELNAAKFEGQRDRQIAATKQATVHAAEADRQRTLVEHHLAAAESRFEKTQAPIQELVRLGAELVRQPRMESRGRQALKMATQFAEALLTENKNDPKARLAAASTIRWLAWTLLEHGQIVDADKSYDKALSILKDLHSEIPGDFQCLRLLRTACAERGVALSQMDQFQSAEQSARESVRYAELLVEVDRDPTRARVGLGNALTNWSILLVDVGRDEDATHALRRAIEIHRSVASSRPEFTTNQINLALANGGLASQLWKTDPEAAEASAIEALDFWRSRVAGSEAPRDEAMYLITGLNQLTTEFSALGRFEEAEKLIVEATDHARSAANAFPEFLGTRMGYVNTLIAARRLAIERGDSDGIESSIQELRNELTAAVKAFPDHAELKELDAWFRYQQALLVSERGDKKEAMKLIVTALNDLRRLQSDSSAPDRYRNRIVSIARGLLSIGDHHEFEREKLDAVRFWVDQCPDEVLALHAFAWRQLCVENTSLRKPDESEALIRRAIALKPDNPSLHSALGAACFYQGRFDEAVAEFQRSLQLNTTLPALDWLYLSMICSKKQMPEEAAGLLKKAETWCESHGQKNNKVAIVLDEARTLILSPNQE